MEYFKKYYSNTLAGSGNHFFFTNEDEKEVKRGRLFYKIFKGGKYNYSLLFSNIVDSTYDNGAISYKNLICDEWQIKNISVAVCDSCDLNVDGFINLTFDGNIEKNVMPGEFFYTDPIELVAESGQYLCIEISFCGKMIPNHEQTVIPTYIFEENKWTESTKMPFPAMIGCDAGVGTRVAFWGDSITQGIGTDINSYEHYTARLAEMIDADVAYWNLGLGYGRAEDAASCGAWYYKALQADYIIICLGVNDIMQGLSAEDIKKSLYTIVTRLKKEGKRILLQTAPPFDYQGEHKVIWEDVNSYIKESLSKLCEGVFDVVPVLQQDGQNPQNAKYGGHPDAEGCSAWAKALCPAVKEFLGL